MGSRTVRCLIALLAMLAASPAMGDAQSGGNQSGGNQGGGNQSGPAQGAQVQATPAQATPAPATKVQATASQATQAQVTQGQVGTGSAVPVAAAVVVLPSYLRADLYPRWVDARALITWPPNNGCAADPVSETVPPGTLIDRFGSENGSFFSPRGESFAARAVPYVCQRMAYTVYRVTRTLPVHTCKAAPWFGEPGGAVQYQTSAPAFRLREQGMIEVVTDDAGGTGGAASPCGSP